jgi:hypothetical protein
MAVSHGRRRGPSTDEWRMLPPAELTRISAGAIDLEFRISDRGEHQGEYEENWVAYRRKFQNAVPRIQQLDIHSSKSTKVIIRREGLKNAYLLHEEIGRGEYGRSSRLLTFPREIYLLQKNLLQKDQIGTTKLNQKLA